LSGEKVGEPSKALQAQLAAMQNDKEDTSCGFAEEGQADEELSVTPVSSSPRVGNSSGKSIELVGLKKSSSDI
jgi:hypothetical protein